MKNTQTKENNELILFIERIELENGKFKFTAKDIDGKDFTEVVNNQKKMKYAFDNKGVLRGKVIKSDNNINIYKFRAVKTKFIKSLKPKTLEDIEIAQTKETNLNN